MNTHWADRCQNIAAIFAFAAIVIAAPGNWKWACVIVASVYLSGREGAVEPFTGFLTTIALKRSGFGRRRP